MEHELEGIDAVFASIVIAASTLTDEYCKQHGWYKMAEHHDEKWFNLRDNVIEKMSGAALKVLREHFRNTCN